MNLTPKRLSLAALVLVLAGGAVFFFLHRNGEDGQVAYQTAQVIRTHLASEVTATGTLSPVVTVEVGSQVSGRIQELGADFNSRVTKGEVIAKIDPQLFQSEVAKAKANLAAARAAVTRTQAERADAKQKFERATALASKRLVAQADADSAQAAYQAATAQVTAAQASLAQATAALKQSRTNLAYTTIVSPIDGIVISRNVDVGQTVAASLQAPTLFTIAQDLTKMEVHTSVAESDVGQLTQDMPVEFTVDAYPAEKFKGVVKQVRYSPTTVQNVVTYDAVVAVDNQALKLRPGMTADVTFLVQQRPNALAVPNAALRFQPPPAVLKEIGFDPSRLRPGARGGGQAGAGPGRAAGAPRADARSGATPRVHRNGNGRPGGAGASAGAPPHRSHRLVWKLGPAGKPEPVMVRTGISDGRQTEIVSGALKEGDQIITGLTGQAGGGQNGAGGRRRFGRFL